MRSKIGIFRALDVRIPHVEFASDFKTFEPFFGANITPEIGKYLEGKHVTFHNIPLTPKFLFDPIYPILNKTDFTPWLQFDADVLRSVTQGIAIYEIYEPYFFYSAQIANLAKKNDVPLVTEIWTSFPEHPARYVPPYSFNVSTVIKNTDLFVLRSNIAESFLTHYKIPENKKVVIYHGVNTDRFIPKKHENEKISILFVGALASHKGLDDILAVFPRLVEKYPQKLDLVICGDGPLRSKVIRLAEELPIIYKGLVSNIELPEMYQSSDIYCQPSKDCYLFGIKGGEEFAGYTFMEALACGLPIVSTKCGGIPEIVGEKNYLVNQGQREQLFHALENYIVNPSLRQEIGLSNRDRAEKLFTLSKQVAVLENVLRKNFS